TRFARLQVALRIPIECDNDVIGHWQRQADFKLSAEDLPVRLSATTSYSIFCPSFRSRMPARSTALICTNTSGPPASGWINPKPFWIRRALTQTRLHAGFPALNQSVKALLRLA